jgi:hypothetical protein
MSDDFRVSQGFDVLLPKSGKAYPIPCEEWNFLKNKMITATTEPWVFHTAGSALIGMALSALLLLLASTFQLPAQQHAHDVTFMIFVCSAVIGLSCLYFAHKERAVIRTRATDVVAQMQIIEQRFDQSQANS